LLKVALSTITHTHIKEINALISQDIWCVPILWAYIILYVFIFPICLRSFGPYNIVLVTDRSIYCHMTLSAMNFLLYRMRYINVPLKLTATI
jgi:hypothetical protein